MKKTREDMTSGRILPQLVMFALPLLGSSLIQQLYNTVDLLFVGNYTGKTGAAAVGASGLVFTCLIGLFTGVSVGTGIVISHAWGAGKREEARKTSGTALLFGLAGSFVLMLVGIAAARVILELLQTPTNIMEPAVTYVRIYFLSMIPMVFYNMGSGVLRSCGESKIPFYILIVGGAANILLDWFLIVTLDLGVAGAAIATSVAQTISAICILYYLMSKRSPIRLVWADYQMDFSKIKKILNYGLPAGIQSIVITLSNVIVQYHINGFGDNAAAAYAAYFKIEGMVYLPILSCGQAVTIFVGQNFGAGKMKRIREGTRKAIVLSCGITILLAGFMLTVSGQIVELFIKDQMVIQYGISIISTTFPLYWLYAILEISSGVLRGIGRPQNSMVIVLLGLCVFRVGLLTIFGILGLGFKFVAVVYPCSWAITAAAFLVMLRKYIGKPGVL